MIDLLVQQHIEAIEPIAEFASEQQMIRRTRAGAVRALRDREGLIENCTTVNDGVANRLKEISLQISRDDDELEPLARQWKRREIGAPRAQ